MPFQPGQSGNPEGSNGQPKRRWHKALERALIRAGEGEYDNGLAKIADRVVAAAIEGDKDAWKEIAEREDGKVPQAVAHQGADGSNTIRHEHIVRTIIDPQYPDAAGVRTTS